MTMNRYYKERDYVVELLNQRKWKSSVKNELKIVAKYLHEQGITKPLELEDKLKELCIKKGKDWYNEVLVYPYIDKAVREAKKKNNPLIQIESLDVTDKELEFITNANYSDVEKKILFGLLVHTKLQNEKSKLRGHESYGNYFGGNIKYSYKSLLDSLNDKYTRTFRDKEIHKIIKKFNDDGLTRTTQKTALELLFINNVMESNEVVIKIKNFDTIGLNLEFYLGNKKVKLCSNCNNQLIVKTNNKVKYCNTCSIETEKENHKNRQKRYVMKRMTK